MRVADAFADAVDIAPAALADIAPAALADIAEAADIAHAADTHPVSDTEDTAEPLEGMVGRALPDTRSGYTYFAPMC